MPLLSAKHGNDLNLWSTHLTHLPQEQIVPETGYEKVKDGEGEERKDKGDEEMQTDMVCMAETDNTNRIEEKL